MGNLRIAYLSDMDPRDRNLYSGGNARIFDALSRHAGEVVAMSPSWHAAEPLRRLILASPEAISIRLRWRAHLGLARVIGAGLRRELARGQYDVLFGAYSFHSLAGLRPPYPMLRAYTSDATPTGYKRSEVGARFGSYLSASRLLDPLILAAERRVFRGLDLALWPGEWQKHTADDLYGLKDSQSVVVPWGANIEDPGPPGPPPALGRDKPLRFLFIGRDWEAKGGPLVLATIERLRAAGIDAHLAVAGCVPPIAPVDWLEAHAELDKSVPAQLAQFKRLFAQAHFMFMASFESWGFAFCEAAAYGLPVLCLRTGGVPVEDGVSGHALLPQEASPEAFAALVERYLDAPGAHAELRRGARARYEHVLNWDAWAGRVCALLEEKQAARNGVAPG